MSDLAKAWQNVVVSMLLLATGGVVFLIAKEHARTKPVQDIVQFWAAARLIGTNPYSLTLVPALEKAVGSSITSENDLTLVTRNPPWALPFYLPLRFVSCADAYAAWTLLCLIIILGCGRMLWRLYTTKPSVIPVFLCLVFAPTLALLNLGQSSVLVLLGITVFFVASERRDDWLAGSALMLVAVKPHISLLFLVTVLLWSAQRKRWTIILAAVVTTCVSTALVLLLNHRIVEQYIYLMARVAPQDYHFPNLGGMLYTVTTWRPMALVPECIGLTWLTCYWWRHRFEWDWKREGLLALIISLACSYYSFGYDEVVILPALIAAAALGRGKRLLVCLILINCGYVVYLSSIGQMLGLHPMFLWWTGSAWLITYLLCRPKKECSTIQNEALSGSLVLAGQYQQ